MRILMITDFYPPILGGIERVVADLSAELSNRNHDVVVATLWHEGMLRRERYGPVTVNRMRGAAQNVPLLFSHPHQRFHPPVPDPLLTGQLRALIARHRPDVMHGHTWMMISALPLRREFRFAAVATLHDYALLCPKKTLFYRDERPCSYHLSSHCGGCASRHYGFAKGLMTAAGLFWGRRAYREVDAFVAISDHVAEAHARSFGERGRIVTIPNFVRDETLRAPPGPPLPDLPREYILFVGALGHHKGLHILLDAYARLETDIPLVLVGMMRPDTPTSFPPNVIAIPGLPHDGVIKALDHCRFVVSPSLWPEPFGLIAIEAMARGKAVIASGAGGMIEIVESGRTGLLVPPGDAAELATAMDALLDDPALAISMGRAGHHRCVAHFSSDVVVSRFEGVYRNVCASARRMELTCVS